MGHVSFSHTFSDIDGPTVTGRSRQTAYAYIHTAIVLSRYQSGTRVRNQEFRICEKGVRILFAHAKFSEQTYVNRSSVLGKDGFQNRRSGSNAKLTS